MSALYHYRAATVRVVDGDTADFDVDLGFYTHIVQQRFRLYGINTPELNSSDPVTRQLALDAKKRVESLLPVGSLVTLETFKTNPPKDKYGRWLATIWTEAGVNVNQLLVDEGLAVVYLL